MSTKIKRFYSDVKTVKTEGGFAVELDGRAIKSPGRRVLIVPHDNFAENLEREWSRQEEYVELATMPVMRFASLVGDKILPDPNEARGEIIQYAGSDLLCYQSVGPEILVERQKQLWDSVLALFEQRENISFRTTTSISHIEQNAADMERFKTLVARLDGFELGAVHAVTTLGGSAVLAMALHLGWLEASDVWQRCQLDEDFQTEQWGSDDEERQRQERRHADFCAATLVYEIKT